MPTKRPEKIILPNDCSSSQIKIHPSNWRTVKASTAKDWYIYYRFYDPEYRLNHPKGKLVITKGMNQLRDATQRRQATEAILRDLERDLIVNGYNPITGARKAPLVENHIIDPTIPFVIALKAADDHFEATKSTKRDIRCTLAHTDKAANKLRIAQLPISGIERKHIFSLLHQIEENHPFKSAHRYNKNRINLMILFEKLIEMQTLEHNPVEKIKKQKTVKRLRSVLTEGERKKVSAHLKENHYRFWMFCNLFFHSGSRLTELMSLRAEKVDLISQRFITVVKKRGEPVEVSRVIKDIALPFWEEFMKSASPKDFLFGRHLQPAPKPMNTDQITDRWQRYVKNELGIDKDFYSLKHLHSTEMVDILGEQEGTRQVAEHNAHTSEAMVINIYDVRRGERQQQKLKEVNNPL